jgi:hypothetical protein
MPSQEYAVYAILGRPVMAPRKKKPERPPSPLVDPSEAVERIVSRRQLLFEDGDVVIMRGPAGLRSDARSVYHLRVRGKGPLSARFVNFDHAAAAGEQLARDRRVRLYYIDSDAVQEVPHLLKDYRPSAT